MQGKCSVSRGPSVDTKLSLDNTVLQTIPELKDEMQSPVPPALASGGSPHHREVPQKKKKKYLSLLPTPSYPLWLSGSHHMGIQLNAAYVADRQYCWLPWEAGKQPAKDLSQLFSDQRGPTNGSHVDLIKPKDCDPMLCCCDPVHQEVGVRTGEGEACCRVTQLLDYRFPAPNCYLEFMLQIDGAQSVQPLHEAKAGPSKGSLRNLQANFAFFPKMQKGGNNTTQIKSGPVGFLRKTCSISFCSCRIQCLICVQQEACEHWRERL